MLEQHIQQQLYDAADAVVRAADPLARSLATAAEAVVGCVTAGGRIWVCGVGRSLALAPLAASQLSGSFERDRPALPAVALDAGAVLPPGTGHGSAGSEAGLRCAAAARQLRAVALPADLLVVLADGPAGVQAMLQAAHDKELAAVVLTPAVDEAVLGALHDTDVLVTPPPDGDGSPPAAGRGLELQLVAWHGLCRAIDHLLLGETTP